VERSAVQRSLLGNVFRQGAARWRGLRFGWALWDEGNRWLGLSVKIFNKAAERRVFLC
jgi:hypothetical protein